LRQRGQPRPRRICPGRNHHYRYFRYGSRAFNCVAPEPFFVLGIRNFATAAALRTTERRRRSTRRRVPASTGRDVEMARPQ